MVAAIERAIVGLSKWSCVCGLRPDITRGGARGGGQVVRGRRKQLLSGRHIRRGRWRRS